MLKKLTFQVILFGHSPPGIFERESSSSSSGHHWWDHNFNRRFVHFVRRFSNTIVGQFFGHQHTDSFRIFRDATGHPISWSLLNPSLSPFKRSMQVGVKSFSTNPAVRLYRFNTYSGEIYDYAQYNLDLNSANLKGSADWQLEYNLTMKYSLPSKRVTPRALGLLSHRLEGNQSWFEDYLQANTAGFIEEGDNVSSCVAKCRLTHLCATRNVDLDDFSMCVSQAKALSAVSSRTLPMMTVFLCVGLVYALIVMG